MGTCHRSSPLLPLCYFSWPWSRETVVLKGCPHFHVTFPGRLGTPEHPEMPPILSTPSYSDPQPDAQGSNLAEGLTRMGSEGHHLQKLNEPRVQNISHLTTPFISGALQLQRLLGLRTRVSEGKVGRRYKIQAHLILSGPKNHILLQDGCLC